MMYETMAFVFQSGYAVSQDMEEDPEYVDGWYASVGMQYYWQGAGYDF